MILKLEKIGDQPMPQGKNFTFVILRKVRLSRRAIEKGQIPVIYTTQDQSRTLSLFTLS
jgi:hypothetical protein